MRSILSMSLAHATAPDVTPGAVCCAFRSRYTVRLLLNRHAIHPDGNQSGIVDEAACGRTNQIDLCIRGDSARSDADDTDILQISVSTLWGQASRLLPELNRAEPTGYPLTIGVCIANRC